LHSSSSASASTTAVDLNSLRDRIQVKGDEIRSLKAAGISKEELQPHVQELQLLKAQLPENSNDGTKVDASTKKKGPATKNRTSKKQPQQSASTKKKTSKGDEPSQLSESELRLSRLAKVQAMREAGAEPFAYSYRATSTASGLAELYGGRLEPGEEDAEADVSVAGRILTRRVFGKLVFFTLQDETGVIQLQFDQNRLGESFQVRS
jgi:hypothetical protein